MGGSPKIRNIKVVFYWRSAFSAPDDGIMYFRSLDGLSQRNSTFFTYGLIYLHRRLCNHRYGCINTGKCAKVTDHQYGTGFDGLKKQGCISKLHIYTLQAPIIKGLTKFERVCEYLAQGHYMMSIAQRLGLEPWKQDLPITRREYYAV